MIIRKIIFLLALSGFLFADSTKNTIFVYGYADTLAEMLSNISLFYTTSFNKIIQASLLVGLFVVIIKSVLNPKANVIANLIKSTIAAIIVIMLFFYAGNGSEYNYTIKDTSNNIVRSVQKVPLGLGKMLEISTNFEKVMTDTMEQALQSASDDVDKFSKSGFIFPLKAKMLYNDITYNNTPFHRNVSTYLNECLIRYGGADSNNVIENVLWGGTAAQNLNRINHTKQYLGENLLDNMQIKGVYQGFLVDYINKDNQSQIVTCKDLYDRIVADFKGVKLDNELYTKYKTLFVDNLAKNEALHKMNNFVKMWSDGIDDSNEVLKHNVLLNALNSAFVNRAETLGVSAKASVFGLATAQMHSKEQFALSSTMAITHLPEIKAIVHITVIALSPLLMLFAILFMNTMFAKTFVTLHLWIVLWNPIIAIINFMITDKIDKIVSYLNSEGISPFSVIGSNHLDGTILDYIAFEGTLWWLVPLLAMAIATGSAYAFTQLATSLGQQFSSASMMGARQVTSMATQGSQSIRDGKSTYTKDGTGVTRNFTDMANGQKVDFAMKYGNADTVQEVEARGTNFAFKTNADAIMMNGRFDNVALNKAMSSGANSGYNTDSGNTQNTTTGGSVNDSGQINNSDSLKNSESDKDGRGNKKDYNDSSSRNDTKDLKEVKDNTNSVDINETKKNTTYTVASAGGNVNAGAGVGYKNGQNFNAGVNAKIEGGIKDENSIAINKGMSVKNAKGHTDGTKFDETKKTSDGEYIGNDHDNTETKDNTIQATTTKGYQNTTSHQKGASSSQKDTYSTQQSENTSLSQNSIAATMNAEMMANGGANMSFEERLSYLTNRMSEIGNQSAFSQDTQALNEQLGAGIDSVQDNTQMVDTKPMENRVQRRKGEVNSQHKKIQSTDVRDTTKIINLADSGMRLKSVNGVEGLYDKNDKLIHSRAEIEQKGRWVFYEGGDTKGKYLQVGDQRYVLGSEAEMLREWNKSAINKKF